MKNKKHIINAKSRYNICTHGRTMEDMTEELEYAKERNFISLGRSLAENNEQFESYENLIYDKECQQLTIETHANVISTHAMYRLLGMAERINNIDEEDKLFLSEFKNNLRGL